MSKKLQAKENLNKKIGSKRFDDGLERRKGTPVEDFFALTTMLRLELDSRCIGGYVLRKGENNFKIQFGFECRGIHSALRDDQVDPIFDALESGLKDFPMGEHLTIHMESFTSDVERQQQLSELIKIAPSQELQFLLMGERARVKELTEQGIRKPKTLRLYASYTVEPDVESGDYVEKLLGRGERLWKSFTGELEKLQFMRIERLLAQAYTDGFQRWEMLLSNKIGLDVRPMTDVELWQVVWRRFNTSDPIEVPQTLILGADGLRESVHSELSPVTLLMADSVPVADRQWVNVKGKYIGVLTFVDKPAGWLDKNAQMRYLWEILARDTIFDTEIICQMSRANDAMVKTNMQRLTKQSITTAAVASKSGTVDVMAGLNLKKGVEAQEALYEGSLPFHTGVVFLVHRDTKALLDDACRFISSLFLRPAWVAQELEYPWLIWTQTFPICWQRLLVKPFNRRQVYLSSEVPGLMPLIKPRAIDKTGLELIAAEGGTPIYIDFCTLHRNIGLFGTTRSGKSVIASGLLTQALAHGMPVVAMDYPKPDGTSTFTDYTEFMGVRGAYFNVSKESSNLLEVPDLSNLSPDLQRDRFEDYKDFLVSALMTMVIGSKVSEDKALADMVRSILTLAIDAFYRDDQIRDRYAQAFTNGFGSNAWWTMPTLHDFMGYCSYERLRMDGVSDDIKTAMNRIKVRLNFWITSRIGKSISKPSTFRSDAQLLIFALANLNNDEDAAILSLSAYSAALRRALASPASVFFIDESPILFEYDAISLLVARLCANGAKAGVRTILSAQDPDSIAKSPGGTKIFQNMTTQLVGRIQPTAVDSFVEILKYPKEVIVKNSTESFFPKKEGIYSQWLINDMGTFTQARFYPSYQLLAAVANNPDEQAGRTAALLRSPNKLLALNEFSKELVAKIRAS
jgi:hypothetical protein